MLTSTQLIVDTNVAIDFINDPEASAKRFSQPATLFLPAIVLGELFFAAQNSKLVATNLRNVERFASATKILVVDVAVAQKYGELWRALVKKGRKIPDSDAWIAAIALSCALPLASRDMHFQEVDGLDLIDW
jgi:tRNA(fMet)-specific endonuclease VapC